MFKIALKPALKMVPILLLCLVNLTLVSCGTKGPLYIPEQRYPQGVEKGDDKNIDKGVNNDATKKDTPAANSSALSSPVP